MKKTKDLKPGDFISAEEIVKIFPGITKQTIYKWRTREKSGYVPQGTYPKSIKLGTTLWFKREDLMAFIDREFSSIAS